MKFAVGVCVCVCVLLYNYILSQNGVRILLFKEDGSLAERRVHIPAHAHIGGARTQP